jgi:hypothetical protein
MNRMIRTRQHNPPGMRPVNPRTSTLSLLLLLTALPACKSEEAGETQGTLTTGDTDGDSDGTPTTSDTGGEPLRTDLFSEGCAQLFSCDCNEYGYADAAQCEEVQAAQYAGLLAIADAEDLEVDESCVKQNDIYLMLGCKKFSEISGEGSLGTALCDYYSCSVAYGTVAVGQPCVEYGAISDCAQGLTCWDKICVDLCQPAMLGEPCDGLHGCAEGQFCSPEDLLCRKTSGVGEPCISSVCAEGLTCSILPGEDSVCVALSGIGESCDFSECAEGLACKYDEDAGIATCGPLPKIGEACQSSCEEGAICEYDGVCVALPGVGDSCLGFACAKGLMCDDSNVCTPEQSLICDDD